jgi:2,3,4,5-tetrahydropyridine-2-carboxylate N-succinyltransferase
LAKIPFTFGPKFKKMQEIIEMIWDNPEKLQDQSFIANVEEVIAQLEQGKLRVAEKINGEWHTHQWIKKAILLYFRIRKMEKMEAGIFEFYDKMSLKKDFESKGIRSVPPAVARYGSYIAPGVILMPSYVNIGARVDEGTMVDTWATVGSCAQIGRHVHLSGGVGIGGVLEPLQANPVIVEDGAFIGSRCIVVEGAIVEERAVLGAGVIITGSTRIIDVTGSEPVYYKGRVPADSVVIPGSYLKSFPAGQYHVPCALIIGKRTQGTDLKVSLNQTLRDFEVEV